MRRRFAPLLLALACACSWRARAHAQEQTQAPAPEQAPPQGVPLPPTAADVPASASSEDTTNPDGGTGPLSPDAADASAPAIAPVVPITPAPTITPVPANDSGPGPDVAAPTQAKRPSTMDEVAQDSEQELHFGQLKARYVFNFFGEVLVAAHAPGGGAASPVFAIGAQDFVLRGQLGNHIAATTEFAIEFGEDNTPGVDLERLGVRWQGEHFYIDAGRSHTDLGYWNTAYHHGHWLQPSIERPSWTRFEDEGGLLPTHWVGLAGGANAKLGTGTLQLTLAVGNSRGKIVNDVRNNLDYQANKAVYGKLEYAGFGALHDLRIGVSGVYGKIAPVDASIRPALPGQALQEWIGGFHIAYPSVPLLIIIEGYLIEHRAAAQTWRTYGGFGLLGYAIGPLTPYVEASEILSSAGMDPFFIPDQSGTPQSLEELDLIAGLRFDVSTWSALKLEYDYLHRPGASERHAVTLDWSWGF